MRAYLSALVICAFLALAGGTGNCAIPPGTPEDTLCRGELSPETCAMFQALLNSKGKSYLKVISGEVFGSVKGLSRAKMTYTALLRCVTPDYFISKVLIRVKNGKVLDITIDPTDERQLPA